MTLSLLLPNSKIKFTYEVKLDNVKRCTKYREEETRKNKEYK